MIKQKQSKNYRNIYIIGVVQTLLFSLVISLIMIWGVQKYVDGIIQSEQKFQKDTLIRLVSMAYQVIEPTIEEVRLENVTPEEGLEIIRNSVRLMTYEDAYGPNYLFMSSYDGIMLVQPYQIHKENTNQWDMQDSNGVYLIRELVKAAKADPSGSFVSYTYAPPGSDIPQKKLSYVIGLPEVNAYLGTGAYQDKLLLEQQKLLKNSRNLLLGLVLLMAISTSLILLRSYRNQKRILLSYQHQEASQNQIKLSQQNLLTVFNNIHDAVVIFDYDGRFIEINKRVLELFRISRETALSLCVADVSEPESKKNVPLSQLYSGFEDEDQILIEWDCVYPNQDGGFIAEAALSPAQWYGEDVVLAVVRDITSRKEEQKERRLTRRMLEHSQSLANIGHYHFTMKTKKMWWSDELFNIYQRNPKLGPPDIEEHKEIMMPGEWEKTFEIQKESFRTREPTEEDYQIRRPDGSIRDLKIIMDWFEDNEKEVIIHTGTIQDITEQRNFERIIVKEVKKLAGLREIDTKIINRHSLDDIFKLILRLIKDLYHADAAAFLIYDEEEDRLEQVKSFGFQKDHSEKTYIQNQESLPWQVIRTSKKISLEKKDFSPSAAACLQIEGFESFHGIPILANDRINGVIEVFYRRPYPLNVDEINYLELLAGQIAIAIETKNLISSLEETNAEVIEAYEATIAGWSKALELRDKETKGHSDRVMWLACKLAEEFNFSEDEMIHFRRGVFLHDIGKMVIPDQILQKPGPLNDSEWEIMKKHPQHAFSMLSEIPYLLPALDIPLFHHERWNGSGYLQGLKEDEIPLAARIFSVVDVWDALTSDRPYRKAWSMEKALAYIKENSGIQFDPEVVEKFVQMDLENQFPWEEDQAF